MTAPTIAIDETIEALEIQLSLPTMGKGGKGDCSTCGSNTQCQNCQGTGKWLTNPNVTCGHCNGSGTCPINR